MVRKGERKQSGDNPCSGLRRYSGGGPLLLGWGENVRVGGHTLGQTTCIPKDAVTLCSFGGEPCLQNFLKY